MKPRTIAEGRPSRAMPSELLMRKPWTPEEDERLTTLLESGYSVEEVASQLEGRSVASIKNRRQVLRKMSGIKPVPTRPWTEDEDHAIVELRETCTLAQIAVWVDRTEKAIIERFQALRRSGVDVGSSRSRKEPFYMPYRRGILLARTCITCGALRGADYYIYKPGRGSYEQECRICQNEKQRAREVKRPSEENRELLQEITKPIAVNEWKKYTQDDLELITDEDKSELEVALTLGRSYFAVCSQRARLEIGPYGTGPKRLNLGDSRWVIDFPSALKALQQHFRKLGEAVPEELWEWNDTEEMAS